MKLRILMAGLMFGAVAFAADAGAELFQKAVTQERAAGNLEEAIKLYQRVAKEFASDRALAAKALVQEARCYEKLGQDKAVKLYEQVARDYRDQREPVAAATARLVVLRQASTAAAPVTMTQRRIELPDAGADYYTYLDTDGQQRVFVDGATGALMISDLANKDKRLIFKPRDRFVEMFMVSRDFSVVLMHLIRPDTTLTWAMVRTDGTGYHEMEGDWKSWCDPDISWDSRSVLLCRPEPDGTKPLLRVSVTDGKMQKIHEAGGSRYRFSPDGRFIAYTDSPGKILVMPSQGGEPQVVCENARALDWTRDGRNLIIGIISPTNPAALYLLPIKDGRGAGDPVFVRYGSFLDGQTTARGAFIYSAIPQGGQFTPWLGRLDSNGRPLGWEKLSLIGSGGLHFPAWSPDSTQIAYVAFNGAAGQYFNGTLRLRNIATGEERELYKGEITPWCLWSAQHPTLVCLQGTSFETAQMVSISTDTGRVERLGSVPPEVDGPAIILSDRAAYFATTHGLMKWEIGSPKWTTVNGGNIRLQQLSRMVSPDERWITRYANHKIEIRPMAGGDWKPLVAIPQINQVAFTPDGNWLVYHNRDASGKDGLFRVATSGGNPERLGDFPAAATRGSTWISPDGQKIITDTISPNEIWMLENFESKPQASK